MTRYLSALPNTVIGLMFLPAVLLTRGGVQIVDGVLELHGPFLWWTLRHCVPLAGGAWAMTLGHVVLGRSRRALNLTRAHERVHVRQYERWGPAFIPAYVLAALWALVTSTGIYQGNFFERQAIQRKQAG